jgi:hypothetical protein
LTTGPHLIIRVTSRAAEKPPIAIEAPSKMSATASSGVA